MTKYKPTTRDSWTAISPIRMTAIFATFSLAWILVTEWNLVSAGTHNVSDFIAALGRGALFTACWSVMLFLYARIEFREIQRLASFPESNPGLVLEVGEDGQLLYANPGARHEYPDLVSQAETHLLVRAAFAISRNLTSDASVQWPEEVPIGDRFYSGSGHRVTGGQSFRFYLVNTTVVHALRKAVREAEARAQFMLENIADFITVIAPNGKILFESPAVEQLGYSPEEMVGKNLAEYLHPDDLVNALNSIERLSQKQGRVERDYSRFRHKNGSWRWLDVSARCVPDLFGSKGAILVNSRDVTDRKRTEDQLKKTQAILKSAQTLARLGCWDLDPTTGKAYWSDEMFTLFGWNPEEGTPDLSEFRKLIHPPDRIKLIQAEQVSIKTCEPVSVEFQANLSENLPRHFRATLNAISEKGGHVRIAGCVQDITDHKKAEERLHKLNRTYAVLSAINLAVARVHERQKLLEDACRIAVEVGGFRMAWVGLVDPSTREVIPLANAGVVGDYLKSHVSTDCDEQDLGPIGWAIRTASHAVSNDLEDSICHRPWCEEAKQLGYRAAAVFPLKISQDARGVLVLYAAEKDYFDPGEIELLEELSRNLTFALEFCEQESRRVLAEKQLEASEHRSKLLLHAIPDMMFRMSRNGVILDYDTTEPEKLYVPPEAFLLKPVEAVLPSDVARQFTNAIKNAFESDRLQTFDYELDIHGIRRQFECRVRANAQVDEAVLIVRDVTEAKHASRRMRQLSRVVEQMDNIVLITNLDGMIEYANPAFARIYGYALEEVIGRNPRLLKSNLESEDFYKRLWATILQGKSFQAEIRNRRKDGRIIYEAKTISPIRDERGVITEFVATGKDITVAKELERTLRERLQEMTCLRRVQHLIEENLSVEALCQRTAELLPPAVQFPENATGTVELDGVVYHSTPDRLAACSIASGIKVNGRNRGRVIVSYDMPQPFILPEEQNLLDAIAQSVGLWLDRRESLKSLQESENRFRQAIIDSPFPTMLHAEGGTILQVSRSWLEISGYSNDEIPMIEDWLSKAHVDDKDQVRASIQALYGMTSRIASGDFRIRTKSGHTRIWDFSAAPLGPLPDGRRLVISMAMDVTERRHAEAELVETKGILQAAMDNSPAGIAIADAPDGKLRYVNTAGLLIRSADEAEIVKGVNASLYMDRWQCRRLDGSVMPMEEIPLARSVLFGEVCTSEFMIQRTDGDNRTVLANSAPVYDSQGKITAAVVVFLDISDRKRSEEALRIREQRYRLLFEDNPYPMYLHDRESLQFLDVNKAAIEKYGYSREEFLEMTAREIRPEEDVPKLVAYLSLHHKENPYDSGYWRHRLRDGTIISVRIVRLDFTLQNRAVVFVMAEDVTRRLEMEDALAESESRFRAFMDNSPAAAWITEPHGEIHYVSEAFRKLFLTQSSEGVPLAMTDVFASEILDRCRGMLEQVAATGKVLQSRVSGVRPDRSIGEYLLSMFPVGKVIGCLALDVTDLQRAEARLRVLGTAIESSPNAVFIADRDGTIQWINPAFTRLSGFTFEEALGQSPRLLRSGRQDTAFYRSLWNTILAGRVWSGEVVERHKDGTEYSVRQTITPLNGPGGEVAQFVTVQEDVTASKRAEARLREMAINDPLTGMLNRSGFRDRLSEGLTGALAALHFVDLDRFKLVNDALGHHAGDALLKQVAERIRTRLRASDVAGRLGGDEFAVMQTGIRNADDAASLARGLQEALERPFEVEGKDVQIGASIGITLYPHDGGDPETLLKNADLAMYRAKEDGRGRFQFFAANMDDMVRNRLSLEGEIRRAIDRAEFEMHYQPQVGVQNGAVIGAEALIRWRHPTRGLLLPGEFLPVAEDSGLILPLSEFVLQESCRQARCWLDAGHPLRVAVNVSIAQVQRNHLVDSVQRALESSHLPAEWLELEITESILLPDIPQSGDIIRDLHALGVRLAIDDFGTGYSSLSYLRRLPVDRLKIDRSFVAGIPNDRKDEILVRAIIGLGHDLGLRVIAEGVETSSQLDFLRQEACNEVQGYFIGRPLPADEFPLTGKT